MFEILESVKILPELKEEYNQIITPEAMAFVADSSGLTDSVFSAIYCLGHGRYLYPL